MANYFTAADINHLNEFTTFALEAPASLNDFRKTINIGFLANWSQSNIFQTNALTSQLGTHAEIWLNTPARLIGLHGEFQVYANELVRSSEQLMSVPLPPPPWFTENARTGADRFLKRLNDEQEAMIRLATGIYKTVPRLVDYMYSNVYQFAGQQNTLADANAGRYNVYKNSLLTIFIAADPTGSRRIEAFRVIDHYQQRYALSYLAASNMIGYFTRLKEMTREYAQHGEALRSLKKTSLVNNRLRLLLISVKAMQHMCSVANGLLQRQDK